MLDFWSNINTNGELYRYFNTKETPLSIGEYYDFWSSLSLVESEYYRAVDLKTGKIMPRSYTKRVIVTNRRNPLFEKRGLIYSTSFDHCMVLFDDGKTEMVRWKDVLVLN